MCPTESELQPPEKPNPLDTSGRLPPPTRLRDLAPFSRGEKIGFGVAVALWLLIPLLLLWGKHAVDSCVGPDPTEPIEICGIPGALAFYAAIAVCAVGLIVAGATARRRARRLRREARLSEGAS